MIHSLVKLKLLKLTLLGAFGAGVVATLIAKEMRKKKKTEDIDGGEIFRDISGNPTGIFNETAQGLISPPKNTFEDHLKALIITPFFLACLILFFF